MKNSRKWKRERAARKKGSRQSGEEVRRRRVRVVVVLRVRVMPRVKERRAIPARDLGWWRL